MKTARRLNMTEQEEQQIDRVIGGRATGPFEHATALVRVIDGMEADTQVEAIARVIERFGHPAYSTGIDIEGPPISQKRLEELRQSLGGMVDGLLRYVISNRMTAKQAAIELHKLIMQRPSEEEKSFCLLYVLVDKCVPYAPITPPITSISSERFVALQEEMVTDIARIRTILAFSKEATVIADLLVSVLDSLPDRERKGGILAYAVADFFQTIYRAQQKI